MQHTFSEENFISICDHLAFSDTDIKRVITEHGYPPLWKRLNTFEALVHIILEQQVSLASALAALNKLKEKIGDITPSGVLLLTDEELKTCYFSRQKSGYVRGLARAIVNGEFDLKQMETLSDEDIRHSLLKLKGIGNWTVDIYLIFVLQRVDIFPPGDLAAVNALKTLKKMPKESSREMVLSATNAWKPFRTVATMILWHYYLSVRIKPRQPVKKGKFIQDEDSVIGR